MLHLPGPAEYVKAAAADIEAGTSVVLVFPRAMIDDGTAQVVLDRVAVEAVAASVQPGPGHLTGRAVAALGLSATWDPDLDPWYDLAHWPPLHGHVLAITGWEEDLTDLLPRWEHLQHEVGGDPTRHVRLVIGADRAIAEQTGLDRRQTLHVRLHWWWGVVERLDTELHIRANSHGGSERLRDALLAELVAWDLPLAATLIARGPAEISDCLPLEARSLAGAPEEILHHGRPSGDRRHGPPEVARPAWDAGELDLWDGVYRPRLTQKILSDALPWLEWRAQARVMFPYLEETRRGLERRFLDAAPLDVAESASDLWELGPMWRLVRTGVVRMSDRDRRLLRAARNVRNRLAHLEPAHEKDLSVLLGEGFS